MPRIAPAIALSDDERKLLRQWSRGRRTPVRLMRRASIVLRAADGWLNTTIASDLGIREKTVGLWRRRFAEQRTAGIQKDAPGRGRPATVQRSAIEAEVIRKTTQERPATATHWSTRTMAAALSISPRLPRPRRGSSPRVRGTDLVRRERPVALRFIPACAGNGRTDLNLLRDSPVHPRVCGERNGK